MCKSQAQGGTRCAAHTRPAFEAATFGTSEWDEAATDYARTPSGNRHLNAMVLEAVAARDWERAAAAQKAMSRADEAEAALVEYLNRRRQMLQHLAHSASEAELRRAAASPDAEVREYVAFNRNAPDDVLLTLASDSKWAVRAEVAKRASAPAAAFEVLMTDRNSKVQAALKTYAGRPRSVVEHWAQSPDAPDRRHAALEADRNGHHDILERLGNDPQPWVRNSVAQATSAPKALLVRLAADDEPSVAAYAMANPSTPIEDVAEVLHRRRRDIKAGDWKDVGTRYYMLTDRLTAAKRFDLLEIVRP